MGKRVDKCGMELTEHGLYLSFLITWSVDLEIVFCGTGRTLLTLAGSFFCNRKTNFRNESFML